MEPNPYEPPRPHASGVESHTYFQPLSTRLSVREYWRLAKNPFAFLLGVAFRLLRVRLPMQFAFTEQFQRIAPEELSDLAKAKLRPLVDQAQRLGMKYAFCYAIPTVGAIEGAAAALRSEDGRVLLPVIYARTWTSTAVDEKVVYAFVTQLVDGRTLVTAGSKKELDGPAELLGEHHPHKPMDAVLERHRQRIQEIASPAVSFRDDDALEQALREYERINFSFQVDRGLYVPLDDEQVVRLRQLGDTAKGPGGSSTSSTLQTAEMCCWIALGFGLFLFSRGQAANPMQLLFRAFLVIAGACGIGAIWLYHALDRRRDDG